MAGSELSELSPCPWAAQSLVVEADSNWTNTSKYIFLTVKGGKMGAQGWGSPQSRGERAQGGRECLEEAQRSAPGYSFIQQRVIEHLLCTVLGTELKQTLHPLVACYSRTKTGPEQPPCDSW